MKDSDSKSIDPIRQSAALILARYFLLHLREELKKDSSLLDHITMEGITFRELTESMVADLLKHFPDLEAEEADFNLFKRWWKRTDPPVKYRKSTFKMYNQVFFHRILDLKYGDSMHRNALFKRLASVLRKSVEFGRGMTYQSLMAGETIMLDELRQALSESENPAECRDLLMRQNQDLAYESFRFFDGILKASLKRSDDLLNTILPAPVAEELKLSGKVIPGLVPDCCVLFADMVDFTGIAEEMSPRELLDELDYCFSHFDRISSLQKMEKIKTIGDSYMCASGLFEPSPSDPLRTALCALRMMEFIRRYQKSRKKVGKRGWNLRIGIHRGPVIAGVVGTKRFTFDIWGDTVNLASRLESTSQPGKINLSSVLAETLSEFFITSARGTLPVKGKGPVDMCFVEALRPEYSIGGRGRVPNPAFYKKIKKLDEKGSPLAEKIPESEEGPASEPIELS